MMFNNYLITGATGYIGSMLAERLIKEGKQVTALVRSPDKLKDSLRSRVQIITGDITDSSSLQQIKGPYDALIHCAAVTRSAYMVSNPVETAESIVDGTRNMLALAAGCQVKSMVYLSSMEVYGRIDCSDGKRITEDELGELDLSQARSCYPMSKRMAEHFCHLYCQEYGVPVKIARLAQTFGRGILPGDSRVFAQFARAIRDNKDIVLHTKGTSMGNYCDIDDVLEALLLLLEKGGQGEVYNIVNEENTMTIREMAELAAHKIAEDRIRIMYEIPEDNRYGYAADTGLRLSSAKLRTLGWEAKTSLEEMYKSLLSSLQ